MEDTWEIWHRLMDRRVPVTLLVAQKESVTDPETVEIMSTGETCQRYIIPNTKHSLHKDRPDMIAWHITTALKPFAEWTQGLGKTGFPENPKEK